MLTVDDYDRIRRRVKIEGLSQREAARELHHSRNTIAKALKHSWPPGYRRTNPIHRPVIEPVKHIIDAWLEDDRCRPVKQRHTARRIHERLRDEYGFQGSESAVCRYVKHKKETSGEVFFPLSFEPGSEAQVDWGEAWCKINGVMCKVMLFCVRLCFSLASFVMAYDKSRMEFLADGHVYAFKFFGGVPRRMAYDNPKTIVTKVGKGRQRELTEDFKRLMSHYLFEARFCNVASGNEKGHVENLVKYSQRNFMTPIPDMSSMSELNAYLLFESLKDLGRMVERKGKTRRELLEEERKYFLPLPETPFEACVTSISTVTKQALVRFDKNDYSTPERCAHHRVTVKGFVDSVKIFVRDELVAEHERSFGSGEYILDPYHYIPLLEKKPGGLINGRPFAGEPWGEDFARMRSELEFRYGGEGAKKFIKILLLFSEYPVDEVKRAVSLCVKRRAFSEDAVKGALNYEPRREAVWLDLSEHPVFSAVTECRRSAEVYDQLIEKENM